MSIDKVFLINLTNDLYRLTALFPKKEPLRYKIREAGSDVLASFVSSRLTLVSENLMVLQALLEVAKNQNWVSPSEILNIQAEYSKLEEAPETGFLQNNNEEESENKSSFAQNTSPVNGQDSRQEKIVQFLKEKGQAQVWQLKQVFPNISKRTLRRDFEDLLKQGLVERIGERNNTYYKIKII